MCQRLSFAGPRFSSKRGHGFDKENPSLWQHQFWNPEPTKMGTTQVCFALMQKAALDLVLRWLGRPEHLMPLDLEQKS